MLEGLHRFTDGHGEHSHHRSRRGRKATGQSYQCPRARVFLAGGGICVLGGMCGLRNPIKAN
eukprot:9739471-Lingulodinium_polyedra.AAC.1